MKILFLSGANSIHTVRWVNALSRKGYEIHLVYQRQHSPEPNLINDEVIQYELPISGMCGYYANCFHLKRIYNKIKPDLVNVHYASGYGTLARMSKIHPIVLSVWGSDVYDFPYQSKLKHRILYKNLLCADKIASTSYVMRQQVEKLIGNKTTDITVTPFGVDLALFRARENNNEIKSGTVNIGIVKTLSPKYGIDYLIRAFKILVESYKEVDDLRLKLIIYGKGEQLAELQNLCAQLEVGHIVEFRGFIQNTMVPEALAELDIFALSSTLNSESFGVAAVEAMAMSLPVVATDADGFTEVVVHEETGLIVPKKDPEAMAQALRKLVEDRPLRLKMGQAGRKRVEDLYDFDKNVEIMEKLYIEIRQGKTSCTN